MIHSYIHCLHADTYVCLTKQIVTTVTQWQQDEMLTKQHHLSRAADIMQHVEHVRRRGVLQRGLEQLPAEQ